MIRRVALLTAAALLAAACGNGLSEGSNDTGGGPTDQNEKATESEDRWVGLDKEAAIRLAESEGRLWRIAREDAAVLAVDSSFIEGRVTFEIDAGIVTDASVEVENPSPPAQDPAPEDPDRAAAVTAAVLRLLTEDNTFGPGYRFESIEIATAIGADPRHRLQGLELESLAAGLQADSRVIFIDGADARIDELFDSSPPGLAVVSVEGIRMDGGRAEIDLRMWCGSLCGIFLTYEVVDGPAGWTVTGTVGPIAVS